MITTIRQPIYLPPIIFFDRLMKSDISIIHEDIKYDPGDFAQRNKIKTSQGWMWLNIPIIDKHKKIKDIKINNKIDWIRKHRRALKCNYSKAPFFKEIYEELSKIYFKNYENLLDLDIHIIKYLVEYLGIKIKIIKSSELNVSTTSTQRLIDLCKKVDSDTYLSGSGGKDYMDENLFKEQNIKLTYQEFKHPTYRQVFKGFEQGLSVIDLIFMYGKKAIQIIKNESANNSSSS